jgi:Transposase.
VASFPLTPPRPKTFRVKKFARKVFVWIFLDQDGIVCIDDLPNGQNINAQYYSSLLVRLKGIFKGKTPTPREGHQGGVVLARHSLAHCELVTVNKMAYQGFQCLN